MSEITLKLDEETLLSRTEGAVLEILLSRNRETGSFKVPLTINTVDGSRCVQVDVEVKIERD